MFLTQPFFWLFVLAFIFLGLSVLWSKIIPSMLFYSRKFLHITVISLLAYAIYILHPIVVSDFIIFLCFAEMILIFAVFKGFFKTEGRRSWGIIYFLPPTILLLTLFPNLKSDISISLLILALADGFSAVIGRISQNVLPSIFASNALSQSYNKRHWNMIHWGVDQKTLVGFFVFVLITFIVLFQFRISSNILFLSYISIAIGSVELLSGRGSDNLFIPLVSFFLILFFKNLEIDTADILVKNWPFLMIGMIGVLAVFKLKWLSISGIVFAIHLAIFVFLCEVSLWPLILFFVVGTLAGKLNKSVNTDEKHNRARDAFQVLANAGVVMILLILSGVGVVTNSLNFLILVSVAVACSDTLSSEIGMKFGKKTVHVLTLKPMEKGISGGVSLAGFMGAIVGACVIACFDMHQFGFILFWGIMGSVLDSVFGMLFQAKYLHKGKLRDQKSGELVKGFSFVTNDFVNFSSNAVIVFLAAMADLLV